MKCHRPVNYLLSALIGCVLMTCLTAVCEAQHSVARQWDEEMLDAIKIDLPRPPVHARNLFHVSVAMYDAWAAYDTVSRGYLFTERITTTQDVETARNEAISFAAYRVLTNRYALSANAAESLDALAMRLAALGYDGAMTSTVGNEPSAVGNRIAEAVIAYGDADGSNQAQDYANTIGYSPVNDPLILDLPGTTMNDPNRWQPLAFDFALTQNGIRAELIQTFVCPHWGKVKPFCMLRFNEDDIYLDNGPPPQFGTETDELFRNQVAEVITYSTFLDPDDGVLIDISPGAYGNNRLGFNDGTGYPTNPVTGQPYESNLVLRADLGRVIAEFWADGPDSETPPGHWNVLANYVSDQTSTVKRIGGIGPVVSDLEWDVKLYLGLNASVHDAAVAAWNHKGIYDSVRPLSAIRWMGGFGQSTDPSGPSYHPNGLPLITNLIEVITADTVQSGERHEHLASDIGKVAVYSWQGQPNDPINTYSGVGWIRAIDWQTYQKTTFVTPPFAGYVSGHSTFSRAAADYLTEFTGSPYFPGGLGEFVAPSNTFLQFELGPTRDIRLQWATYFDAADEAGISRLYGGIHIEADDRLGRMIGAAIGQRSWNLAQQYFNGVVNPHPPFEVSSRSWTPGGDLALEWPAVVGREYVIEAVSGFTNSTQLGTVTATGTWVGFTNSLPVSGDSLIFKVSVPTE